ncbi:hypothetical protein Q7C36_009857 [Tachysurus vachellii]|uniref:Uncharacterized protein n=1 Tax=Tachysurus vachellii TaxID=175792 RepID=A0AA88STR4_TACVA|nr:hypothetical protein Q7C36_009857 [Tachysurus vachellii]
MEGQNSHGDWIPTNFKICISGVSCQITLTVSDDSHKKQKVTPQCLWKVEDYSEHVALSVKSRVIYACQHGKNYKKTTTTDDLHTEHEYTRRKRFHVECPAKVYVRYVER